MNNDNYIDIIYNPSEKPFTEYPSKLISYLISRYNIKKGSKVLELGCGRGEFLNEFMNFGMDCYGLDLSNSSKNYFPKINLKICDLEKEKSPYNDNYFDIVYSKSFVEHFYYPEKIFNEAYRLLKPGGLLITLTPEWNYIYKTFYHDFTHRTPFTKTSLMDIQKISNFKDVKVESFKQLPILWPKTNLLIIFFKFLSLLTRIFLPNFLKIKSKWIKFSKEVMILSCSKK